MLREKNVADSTWHTNDLDEFVKLVDKLGGVKTEAVKKLYADFTLQFDTVVDVSLDPTSEEYHKQQTKLYEEISGRSLNQIEGEYFPVPKNYASSNPYGSKDIRFMSKHSRAVLTSIMIADLEPDSWVLDLGCGWGLSTENFAFCGANVHAVDINSEFTELVSKRCASRNYSVVAETSEFDSFESDKKYDMVFFYECLHHSVSILKTLDHIKKFVKPDGCIVFCGEPINSIWWKNWGMRLDPHSVYCTRKFGWFESGWSTDYLKMVFENIGWKVFLFPGIGLGPGHLGLAVKQDFNDNIIADRLSAVCPNPDRIMQAA